MSPDNVTVFSTHFVFSYERSEEIEKDQRNGSREKNVSYWNVLHLFSVLGFCAVFASSLLLIPRSNSIFYQNTWLEFNLPVAALAILTVGIRVLDMATYFNERSLNSFNIFFRIYLLNMTTWIIPYIIAFVVWSSHLGYNWPMPYLGYNIFISSIASILGMWFVFPNNLRSKKEFQRNMKLYMLYFVVLIFITFLREGISFLFKALPPYLQWIIGFLIPLLKHSEKWSCTKVIRKMTGGKNEASNVLLGISVNATYSYFVALRISGAETITVCSIIAVDFILQLYMTYKIVRIHKKVENVSFDCENVEKQNYITQLVLAELTEGITPIVYAIGFAMAYYGPNGSILGNVRNDYWGYKKVDDVGYHFLMMLLLFSVDTLSMILNSFGLSILTDVKLLKECCYIMKKYWLFMALRFALSVCNQYATNDINLGIDSTGQWEWITKEGRFRLIQNSTELSEEERSILLTL